MTNCFKKEPGGPDVGYLNLANSLPSWSNEVSLEKLIAPDLFRNFPRVMEREF